MTYKEKCALMYNKLVTFLYEIDVPFMQDNFPAALKEFLTAGYKLRNQIDKNL